MKFGLILRNTGTGSSREAIEAGAETVERLGWETVWTTDHVLVPRSAAVEYGRTFEAIATLAWVGARHPKLRLGASVIVVPQRNAVLLAKELATLDVLSEGRLIVGVGAGWNETEFANLGASGRFHRRGAYLDETIRLWRHLWSGSAEPFEGAFHGFSDFVFGPLPAQKDRVPIVVGGASEAALRRAGALGDGYHATRSGPEVLAGRIPTIRAAADAAGRPMPGLSVRTAVATAGAGSAGYSLAGDPESMVRDVRAFDALGVEHMALVFGPTEPAQLAAVIERFDMEVVKALAG
ncbi:MAG TPA: TIGR03619 family F420-dependent LLM class oxidoreductase [Candidatus Limnocylindrales bacterium]|jgi:probable F420-dependent oxidoreductase